MCGIALPYARATLVKTSYSLPEKISRASILPSISDSQAVCARTLNREVRSLALAISCEVSIVPNRMIPTSIRLTAIGAKDRCAAFGARNCRDRLLYAEGSCGVIVMNTLSKMRMQRKLKDLARSLILPRPVSKCNTPEVPSGWLQSMEF